MLIDLLIVIAVGLFIATRFFGFRLPRDEQLKNRKKGSPAPRGNPAWQEMMDKLRQPDPLEPVELDAQAKPVRRTVPKVKVPAGVTGIDAIRAVDENFDEKRFLEGVEQAYRYFYERWNALDEAGLDNLCGPQMMEEIKTAFAGMRKRGVKPNTDVQEMTKLKIADGRVLGRSEIIEVDITARQSEGEVGQVAPVRTVKVRWVLARAVGSDDPNWELHQATTLGASSDA